MRKMILQGAGAAILAGWLATGGWAQEPKPAEAEKKQDAAKPPAEPVRPVPPVPAYEPSWGEKLIGIPIHGALTSRLRVRWTEGEHDTDLYETLSLKIGDPERHTVTATFLGRAAWDLDGESDTDGYYVFDSLEDTYDKALTGQVYEATLDFHRLGPVELARAGRMTLYDTPVVVSVDGGWAETEDLTALKIRLGAYGGLPVHFYESSPEGDLIAGGYAQMRPWEGGRVRADYMYVDDEYYFGEHQNELIGVGVWQDLFDRVQMHALYTWLEQESRDILVRATYREPDIDLLVQASWYRLFQTQEQYAIEFDPFYNSALEYDPYDQFRGLVSKGFGDHFVVDGGADVRRLRRRGDEGPYNHEFERYYVTPSMKGIPWEGLSVSLTGEFWDSDDDVWSWGADVTQKLNDRLKGSVGTYYSLYKYDYYANQERDDVRTLYLRLRYKLATGVRVDGGYEYEHSDLDTIHTMRLGLIWEF